MEYLGEGGELEIVLDATSGKVLSKERDNGDDEDEQADEDDDD